jgi:tetratricopeptide (TPR) repeat protein
MEKTILKLETKSQCTKFNDEQFQKYFWQELPPKMMEQINSHIFSGGCRVCFERLNRWWRHSGKRETMIGTVIDWDDMREWLKEGQTTGQQEFAEKAIALLERVRELQPFLQGDLAPNRAQCPRWDDSILLRFFLKELPEQDLKNWDEHLAVCPDCQNHTVLLIRERAKARAEIKAEVKAEVLAEMQLTEAASPLDASVAKLATHAAPNQPFLAGKRILPPVKEASLPNNLVAFPRSQGRMMLKVAASVALVALSVGYILSNPVLEQRIISSWKVLTKRPSIEQGIIAQIEQLVKDRDLDRAQKMLTPILEQTEAVGDIALHSKCLYLQGRLYSEKADFSRAVISLEQAINIAKPLNDSLLLLGPTITLANIYHFTDQNAAAAAKARHCLDLARQENRPLYEAMSLQVLAISELFAYDSSQSEDYLKQSIAIALAEKTNGQSYVVQGYTYLGILHTEHQNFDAADQAFKKALEIVASSNNGRRHYLEYTVAGYYARAQALAGKMADAATLYQTAIDRANEVGVQQSLALSQLNRGLSDCYRATGDEVAAADALLKAETLEQKAAQQCEVTNTAMSFAPKRLAAKRCN